MHATEKDIQHIEKVYENTKAYHGDFHNHASTGGTSDGHRTLEHWKGALEALEMDFASILDHKQVRHMFLPEWDDTIFIGGSEPGTIISDTKCEHNWMHYNMVFSKPEPLMELLGEFPEFEYTGGPEGHFIYVAVTRQRMIDIIHSVKKHGGFWVHPHPKDVMKSDNPLDYWFEDETGIEIFYNDLRNEVTQKNYELWCDLLKLGKRVWACAGEDGHSCARDTALTTFYAEVKNSDCFLAHAKQGDMICGGIGIRMCIGDTKMGGKCDFDGKRLVVSVGDFHRSCRNPEHTYRMDIFDDKGVVFSEKVSCLETSYFALDASKDAKFYRVEVTDENENLRVAVANPIWNYFLFN
jgi:hypothetical protein